MNPHSTMAHMGNRAKIYEAIKECPNADNSVGREGRYMEDAWQAIKAAIISMLLRNRR